MACVSGDLAAWAALLILCRLRLRLRLLTRRLGGRCLGFEPRHVLSKFGTDLFDRLCQILIPQTLIFGLPYLVFGDPLTGKGAALDVTQDFSHALACFVIDDPRPRDEITIFGGFGDEMEHLLKAAFVHEVDDQLELVKTLEISDLRLVTGVDERIPGRDVGLNLARIDVAVSHVRSEQANELGSPSSFSRRCYCKAVGAGLPFGRATRSGADDDFKSTIPQVARVSPSLASVADDRDRTSDCLGIGVFVSVNPFHSRFPFTQKETPAPVR